jgi:hypothetical protein
MKWLERIDSWSNRLPGWLNILLGVLIFPPLMIFIAAPLIGISMVIGIPIAALLLAYQLIHEVFFNRNWWAKHPVAHYTLDQVHEHAQSLSLFLAGHPDDSDCFLPASELCKELMRLAVPGLSPEAAKALEKRLQVELKWCKGPCFSRLHLLCRRLVELSEDKKPA